MQRLTFFLLVLVAGGHAATAKPRTYGPDNLPPFVHPPVMTPIPDGIQLTVPKQLGNQELARWGFVDVTAAPFHADPTGKRDSTRALQQAINFARDAQLVCFFPRGVYVVSDTLILRHGIHMRSHRATFINNKNMPCVLVGSRRGQRQPGFTRPRIVLRAHSPGFGDVSHPKAVLEHWQYAVKKFTVDPDEGKGGGASLMNTMVVGLDIVIGPGNPGAVGMHIRSCEGSAVQDVTIDARHGHTGLLGGTGNGGSWTNITVLGGRIGLDLRGWTPPTPTLEGITLSGQTQAALVSACRGPLVAVGVHITTNTSGPVVVAQGRWAPFDAGLTLVDSEIMFTRHPPAANRTLALTAERSVYLHNVFVRGAGEIVEGALPGNPHGWTHVVEFARGSARTPVKGYSLSAPIYVQGRKVSGPLAVVRQGESPPADLVSRHGWKRDFPGWESPGATNVKAPPYNAKGDSYADDTEALQRAVDEHEVVFLPKGYYRLTHPLSLRPNTKLIGVAQHLSVLLARDPAGTLGDANSPRPLVDTADVADADTVLAFLGLRYPLEVGRNFAGARLPVYALRWRCGGRSVVRSCEIGPLRVYGFIGSKTHKQVPLDGPTVVISGHGGGRWYNYHVGLFFTPTTRRARALLINGVPGPLRFYNFEPQGGNGDTVVEVRHSRNVTFFGCKTECDTTFLQVTDSADVRVFGHGGIGNAARGGALYVFRRTPVFLVANLADQVQLGPDRPYYAGHGVHRNIDTYYPLWDEPSAGAPVRVPPRERPVLYRRGHPTGAPPSPPDPPGLR